MRIVLVSDSHGDIETLRNIATREGGADYYLHCGDCASPPAAIRPFAAVRGNVDSAEYPPEKIISINDNITLLMVHGHGHDVYENRRYLAEYAKLMDCSLVFFGHLHLVIDEKINGIRLLNPGSIRGNRDGSPASYLVLDIDGNQVKVEQYCL